MAAAPQFTVGSRAASMTDALRPATPQPLEKERDDYFRKVGGESLDPLRPHELRSAPDGARGRGRPGPEREGEGKERRGRAGTVRAAPRGRTARGRAPRADGSRAAARRCTGEARAGAGVTRVALSTSSRRWGKDWPLATLASSVPPRAATGALTRGAGGGRGFALLPPKRFQCSPPSTSQ